jgi:predicted AAA+ superfamily ATPase
MSAKNYWTMSAPLETFTNVSDSLAGRYFLHRLDPIDIQEAVTYQGLSAQTVLEYLLTFSGFPEPFLKGNRDFHRKWQRTHLDIIISQDFLDRYAIRNIRSLEAFLKLLQPRVGSPVAYATLATDLQRDQSSVKSWLLALENIYALFKITPYHTNIACSLCLLKAIHRLEDSKDIPGRLHYLRTKDGLELDFLVVIDDQPILAIEVKTADCEPAKPFKHFEKFLPASVDRVQLVKDIAREYDIPSGLKVRRLSD